MQTIFLIGSQLIVLLQRVNGQMQSYGNTLMGFVTFIAGLAFLLYLIWGGFQVFREFSAGNPEQAKNKAINLLVGAFIFAIIFTQRENITNFLTGTSVNTGISR